MPKVLLATDPSTQNCLELQTVQACKPIKTVPWADKSKWLDHLVEVGRIEDITSQAYRGSLFLISPKTGFKAGQSYRVEYLRTTDSYYGGRGELRFPTSISVTIDHRSVDVRENNFEIAPIGDPKTEAINFGCEKHDMTSQPVGYRVPPTYEPFRRALSIQLNSACESEALSLNQSLFGGAPSPPNAAPPSVRLFCSDNASSSGEVYAQARVGLHEVNDSFHETPVIVIHRQVAPKN